MILDLSKVLKFDGYKVIFDDIIDIGGLEFNGDTYHFTKPITVKGYVQNARDILQLHADISCSINVKCYRCMENTQEDLSFSMNEVLANKELPDEEIIQFDGTRIDLKEIIINNILINISMKHLCSEDCKGLCPICGVNLNEDDCGCNLETVDPRFEVLKKLIDNN